jgi:hypothetical protein
MLTKRFDRITFPLVVLLVTSCASGFRHSGEIVAELRDTRLFPRGELRVLTLNVEMLPAPIGDTETGIERARRIAQKIEADPKGYDVLVFTECFDEEVRDELVRLLTWTYRWSVSKCATPDMFRQDAGLCLFSRYPIKHHRGLAVHDFTAFPWEASGTPDMGASKGILGVPIDLSSVEENRVVWIFVTHLQSDPGEVGEHADIRARQLERVRRFIDDRVFISPREWNLSVLLTGDLNVPGDRGTDTEWSRMMEILGTPRDLFTECRPDEAGATWIEPGGPGLRLDYFLAFDRVPCGRSLRPFIVPDCYVQEFRADGRDLSDHHGLVALAAM